MIRETMRGSKLVCALLFFQWGQSIALYSQAEALNAVVEKDVVYGEIEGRDLLLDLYLPNERERPTPVIFWIHGGAWRAGNKNSIGPARGAVDAGFAVASVGYRLSGEARFPAAIEDCKAAVRFVRSHASQWQLDPERFGVWGSSAGGHLAALVGVTSGSGAFEEELGVPHQASAVQAVCDWFGPTDFSLMDTHAIPGSRIIHDAPDSPESMFVRGPIQDSPYRERVRQANPIAYVSADDPPFLIVHGDRDLLVAHPQSEILHEALRKASVPSELILSKGAGHGLRGGEPDWRSLVDQSVAFFRRELTLETGETE